MFPKYHACEGEGFYTCEPDFGVTSVNYDLGELLTKAEEPGRD